VCFPETLVSTYKGTRRHNLEERRHISSSRKGAASENTCVCQTLLPPKLPKNRIIFVQPYTKIMSPAISCNTARRQDFQSTLCNLRGPIVRLGNDVSKSMKGGNQSTREKLHPTSSTTLEPPYKYRTGSDGSPNVNMNTVPGSRFMVLFRLTQAV
jgi:hypothetical protein